VNSEKTIQDRCTEVIETTSITHLHRNNEILATLFTPPTIEDKTVLALSALTANMLMMQLAAVPPNKKRKKRKNDGPKRCQRRRFLSDQALQAIQRDYLESPGDLSTPLFGPEFKWMFHFSRPRFELLVQDVLNLKISSTKEIFFS
jgi:hypothetical protein